MDHNEAETHLLEKPKKKLPPVWLVNLALVFTQVDAKDPKNENKKKKRRKEKKEILLCKFSFWFGNKVYFPIFNYAGIFCRGSRAGKSCT